MQNPATWIITILYILLSGSILQAQDIRTEYYRLINIDFHGQIRTEGKYTQRLGQFLYNHQMTGCYKAIFSQSNSMSTFYTADKRYEMIYKPNGCIDELMELDHQSQETFNIRFLYNQENFVTQRNRYRRIRLEGSDELDLLQRVSNTFNQQNLLITSAYLNNNDEVIKTVSYTYNQEHSIQTRTIQAKDTEILEEFSYDTENRPISIKKFINHTSNSEIQFQYTNHSWFPSSEKTYMYNLEYMAHSPQGTLEIQNQAYPDGIFISGIIYNEQSEIIQIYESRPYLYGYMLYHYKDISTALEERIQADYSYIFLDQTQSLNRVQVNYLPTGQRVNFSWINENNQNLLTEIEPHFLTKIRINDLMGCQYLVYGKILYEGYDDTNLIVELQTSDGQKSWCDTYMDYFYYFAKPDDPLLFQYNTIMIRKKGREDKILPFSPAQGPIIWLGDHRLEEYHPNHIPEQPLTNQP